MTKYTIDRTDERKLQFDGQLLAAVESSHNNASASYSGATGRWQELRLYRTAAGRYVCEQVDRTLWQGEHDRTTVRVVDTVDDVAVFFGAGWLAKDLYEAAGIEVVETVD